MATIYINGVSLKKSKFGIKFSGKADELIKQLQEHTNEKGYFNFEINERKEADKYGNTHYIKVDEWKPETKMDPNVEAETIPDSKGDSLPF